MAKKGLNMEKVVEIRNEVEEVMEVETTPIVVQEMAEHVGASLEDIDALREVMIEEQMKEYRRFKRGYDRRTNERNRKNRRNGDE